MVIADDFPLPEPIDLQRYRLDRIMYGSDFSNIPYAWDRELKRLRNVNFTDDELKMVVGENAAQLFGTRPSMPASAAVSASPWTGAPGG